MSNPYIAQDVLDQCDQAIRDGRSLEYLAGQLRCTPEHLGQLLGMPSLQPVPTDDQDQDFDLFEGAERLGAQL